MVGGFAKKKMASSSVSQEDVEKDFQLLSRRSKIRTARARNPLSFSQRPDEMEAEDREESPKPVGKTKERRAVRTERQNFVNKGKLQRDRRKLREKRRSTGVVHLQSTESTGGSTGEDDGEQSPSWDETKKNTVINEGSSMDGKGDPKSGGRNYIGPSDLEADDEDTQDGDSLNHLKLDINLTELNIKEDSQLSTSHDSTPESPPIDLAEQALQRAKQEMKQLNSQLGEARREISLLKAERDFLREQNLGLRNQALANKK
ncbi:PRKC apoptosis WT1 regulator protein-like isoform X3 [Daphnia pulex]|uniref:PRKC apoptosis WT1 regulator protein-like isoform X3 n=1 Tax=Daphnia pulex TaxID=6669 RepID=UPI001EDE50C4|nr:PRKC apoptosis WT1 regulator protein-like isoform X3 [Daphnia pulex]